MAIQTRVGWRSFVTSVVNAVDADATAFISAAGITNLTQAAAINTLVNDLKTYGIWTKMKAIYPFVGGNATSHKFNLKDPRDLDAAFRLVFNGGWTHTSGGAKTNGTNATADTKLSPSSILTQWNTHLSLYSRTSTLESSNIDMGSADGSAVNIFSLNTPRTTGSGGSTQYSQTNASEMARATGLTDASGFWMSNRTSNVGSTHKYIRNGSILGSATTSAGSLVSQNVNIGSLNGNYFANKEFAFSTIGDGLTDTEATNFYTAVQKFQTTLGRQIGAPIVSDSDAQAFLNVAGITDLGQANAVNTLVTDLKAAGIWTKMKAIYPFVGGTATAHSYNLINTANYQLTFTGGWIHNSSGSISNGTNAYANMNVNANQIFTSTNGLLGFYTPSTGTTGSSYIYGVSNMADSEWSLTRGTTTTNFGMYRAYTLSDTTSMPGMHAVGMDSNGWRSIYKNGTRDVTQNYGFIAMPQNLKMYLGARNANGTADGFTGFTTSFGFFSDTLTLTENSSFYTAVQRYQTTLGRQIGTPIGTSNIVSSGLVMNLDSSNPLSYSGTGTTWTDLIGGNNGTLVNGPTYDATNGGSIVFDGVNDNISSFPSQISGSGTKTIDVWFKSTTTSRAGLCGTRDGYTNSGWVFTINRTSAGNLSYFHTGGSILEVAAGITTNTWYNAVITYDSQNGSVNLYLNGTLKGSTTFTAMYNSSFNGVIGGEDGNFAIPTPFKGNISSTKVYNRALSSSEVLQNFNATKSRFGL